MEARLRTRAINALISMISIAAAIVAAEALVRVIEPQQLIILSPEIWQPVDTLGWVRRPHVATTINTGERTVSVFTDEGGFRVGEGRGRDDSEAAVRVLLLGDSFMEALQVEYEQSLAGLLEDRLSERLGKPVVVKNAGVSGWGAAHYFLQARSLLAEREFDLVITAIYVIDDAVRERFDRIPPRTPVERKHFRMPRSPRWSEAVDAILHPANDWLEERSHLFTLLKNRLELLRMKLQLTPAYFPPVLLRREATASRWSVTTKICRDLDELASEHGAESMFFLIPASYQVYSDVFRRYIRGFGIDSTEVDPDQPNRLLADSLTAHGLHVVDVLPEFRAHRASDDRLYGTVDPHLSPEGHRVLASIVAPYAARLLGSASETPIHRAGGSVTPGSGNRARAHGTEPEPLSSDRGTPQGR